MNGSDRMIELLEKACETALGDEWREMTSEEKRNTVMSFISTAAANARK